MVAENDAPHHSLVVMPLDPSSMSNPTKVEIDTQLVRRLVRTQFPQWSNLSIESVEPNGWDNRTYRLGKAMSVRLPSAECYAVQVEKEQRWLPKLAPLLPLAIPAPLAMGLPTKDYPWRWSVYRWLEGEHATAGRIKNMNRFATTLAQFLVALWQADTAEGPPPGEHNFFRGGPLAKYDSETRDAIDSLCSRMDASVLTEVWETSLKSTWNDTPVWVHGDLHGTNLLVRDGCLSAVIDFGCLGVGDPACDFTIAWTLFSVDSRREFRAAIPIDDSTWTRSRGWALWKGLITLLKVLDTNPRAAASARQTIDAVLADHQRAA